MNGMMGNAHALAEKNSKKLQLPKWKIRHQKAELRAQQESKLKSRNYKSNTESQVRANSRSNIINSKRTFRDQLLPQHEEIPPQIYQAQPYEEVLAIRRQHLRDFQQQQAAPHQQTYEQELALRRQQAAPHLQQQETEAYIQRQLDDLDDDDDEELAAQQFDYEPDYEEYGGRKNKRKKSKRKKSKKRKNTRRMVTK